MPDFPATGKYFEDIIPGEERLTPGRTINPADIDLFAEWTGDTTFLNVPDGASDARRVVTPILIVNLADDLSQRTGWVEGTGYCNLGWTWTFHQPVYEMDTIWVRMRWTGARESKSLPHVGNCRIEHDGHQST
jgi:acyl dehydratase